MSERESDEHDVPAADDVQQRTFDFLRSLGATDDELAEPGMDPSNLAARLTMLPTRDTISIRELAERADADLDEVMAIRLALGHPATDPDAIVASEDDVELFRGLAAASAFFGSAAIHDIARVIGVSVTRIADALISTFLVNVTRQHLDDPETDLVMAQANAAAAQFMPLLRQAMDSSVRRHIIENGRATDAADGDFETQELAVGFIDLVGSTRLTRTLSFEDAGRLFRAFDEATTSTITAGGGRVVKLIGDEVMFAAGDVATAIEIADAIRSTLGTITAMPPIRGGVAYGPALLRDGDVYGDIVNLAARLAKHAAEGVVLVADPSGAVSAGEQVEVTDLAGIDEPVRARRI